MILIIFFIILIIGFLIIKLIDAPFQGEIEDTFELPRGEIRFSNNVNIKYYPHIERKSDLSKPLDDGYGNEINSFFKLFK